MTMRRKLLQPGPGTTIFFQTALPFRNRRSTAHNFHTQNTLLVLYQPLQEKRHYDADRHGGARYRFSAIWGAMLIL